MWHLLTPILQRFAVRLTLPFAIVAGAIGYVVEGFVSDRYTPPIPSVQDEREKRLLEESMKSYSLKEKTFVPKTVFERNLSPSLLKEDNKGKK